MTIKDKLRYEISGNKISLQPNRNLLSSLIWFVAIILATIIALVIFWPRLEEGWLILGMVLIIYFSVHGLIDAVFRLRMRYVFDGDTKKVYKESPVFGRKSLLDFEEAVFFVKSEADRWYYAMGAKKKQFLKNYKVSPTFGSGKSSEQKAQQFEDEILNPILDLIGKDKS